MKLWSSSQRESLRSESLGGAGGIVGGLFGVAVCAYFSPQVAESWFVNQGSNPAPLFIRVALQIGLALVFLGLVIASGAMLGRVASNQWFGSEDLEPKESEKKSSSSEVPIRKSWTGAIVSPVLPERPLFRLVLVVVAPLVSFVGYLAILSGAFQWFWEAFPGSELTQGYVGWIGSRLNIIGLVIGIGSVVVALMISTLWSTVRQGRGRK